MQNSEINAKYISEVGSSAVENFCEVGSRAVAQYSSRNSTAYDLQYGWQNDTANSQNGPRSGARTADPPTLSSLRYKTRILARGVPSLTRILGS